MSRSKDGDFLQVLGLAWCPVCRSYHFKANLERPAHASRSSKVPTQVAGEPEAPAAARRGRPVL